MIKRISLILGAFALCSFTFETSAITKFEKRLDKAFSKLSKIIDNLAVNIENTKDNLNILSVSDLESNNKKFNNELTSLDRKYNKTYTKVYKHNKFKRKLSKKKQNYVEDKLALFYGLSQSLKNELKSLEKGIITKQTNQLDGLQKQLTTKINILSQNIETVKNRWYNFNITNLTAETIKFRKKLSSINLLNKQFNTSISQIQNKLPNQTYKQFVNAFQTFIGLYNSLEQEIKTIEQNINEFSKYNVQEQPQRDKNATNNIVEQKLKPVQTRVEQNQFQPTVTNSRKLSEPVKSSAQPIFVKPRQTSVVSSNELAEFQKPVADKIIKQDKIANNLLVQDPVEKVAQISTSNDIQPANSELENKPVELINSNKSESLATEQIDAKPIALLDDSTITDDTNKIHEQKMVTVSVPTKLDNKDVEQKSNGEIKKDNLDENRFIIVNSKKFQSLRKLHQDEEQDESEESSDIEDIDYPISESAELEESVQKNQENSNHDDLYKKLIHKVTQKDSQKIESESQPINLVRDVSISSIVKKEDKGKEKVENTEDDRIDRQQIIFKCRGCNEYENTDQDKLAEHIKTNHVNSGLKAYPCAFCQSSFVTRSGCRIHLRKTHIEEIHNRKINLSSDAQNLDIESSDFKLADVTEDPFALESMKRHIKANQEKDKARKKLKPRKKRKKRTVKFNLHSANVIDKKDDSIESSANYEAFEENSSKKKSSIEDTKLEEPKLEEFAGILADVTEDPLALNGMRRLIRNAGKEEDNLIEDSTIKSRKKADKLWHTANPTNKELDSSELLRITEEAKQLVVAQNLPSEEKKSDNSESDMTRKVALNEIEEFEEQIEKETEVYILEQYRYINEKFDALVYILNNDPKDSNLNANIDEFFGDQQQLLIGYFSNDAKLSNSMQEKLIDIRYEFLNQKYYILSMLNYNGKLNQLYDKLDQFFKDHQLLQDKIDNMDDSKLDNLQKNKLTQMKKGLAYTFKFAQNLKHISVNSNKNKSNQSDLLSNYKAELYDFKDSFGRSQMSDTERDTLLGALREKLVQRQELRIEELKLEEACQKADEKYEQVLALAAEYEDTDDISLYNNLTLQLKEFEEHLNQLLLFPLVVENKKTLTPFSSDSQMKLINRIDQLVKTAHEAIKLIHELLNQPKISVLKIQLQNLTTLINQFLNKYNSAQIAQLVNNQRLRDKYYSLRDQITDQLTNCSEKIDYIKDVGQTEREETEGIQKELEYLIDELARYKRQFNLRKEQIEKLFLNIES